MRFPLLRKNHADKATHPTRDNPTTRPYGSSVATEGALRAYDCSTFDNAMCNPAASANDGSVAPIGRAKSTMRKYSALPGIQLAKAGHRHRGAASKKSP
jgi:hypothetical protein